MSLNPTGGNYNWNYSNPNKDGYSETMVGTVVSLQEVQKRAYNPGTGQPGMPEFWPDGNPKMNIRMGMATPDGQLKSITFQPAGKAQRSGEKPSLHMNLFALTDNTDMSKLIGMTIQLTTWPANPQTGQAWGPGNPRLFDVQVVEGGPFSLAYPLPEEFKVPRLLANEAVSGGQIQQPYQPQPTNPAYIQTPQPVQYQQPNVQPVQPMNMGQVASVPNVTAAQPVMQQQPTTQVQAMQPAVPAGMDPQIAAQMQAMGATNVQQVDPYSEEGLPF